LSEQVKSTAVKFFEEQDRLRGGPADELCAEEYTAHLTGFPAMDLAGHKAFAAAFYAGFPDIHHTIDEVVAEGDRAMVRFTLRGTHTESFMGIPASGNPVEVAAFVLMTLADGKVTHLRGQFDQLGLMQQIGALPDQ
jgi:predicted ester cyclase